LFTKICLFRDGLGENRLFSQKCQLSRKMPIISQFKKKVVEYRTRAEYLEHKLK